MSESRVTVTVDLPATIEGESSQALARRLKCLWVFDEVRQGRMTRVRAAKVLGMSLDDFLGQANAHGVDAIDYDLEDFRRELSGAP